MTFLRIFLIRNVTIYDVSSQKTFTYAPSVRSWYHQNVIEGQYSCIELPSTATRPPPPARGGGGAPPERTNVRSTNERRQASRGRQSRRDAVEADSNSSPQGRTLSFSLSRSLATLVTPTTSTPVQDNISLILLLCSILHQPIWAGIRSDKFTGRLTVLAGSKRRQYLCHVQF
jgi:hypothetical protein